MERTPPLVLPYHRLVVPFYVMLTRAALASPAESAALGEGGGKYYPLCLLIKQRAVEIHGRRQSEARNEKVQMSAYFFFKKGQMRGQGQLKGQDIIMEIPVKIVKISKLLFLSKKGFC